MNEAELFANPIIDKVLRDSTQFPNRILTSVRGGFKTFNAQKVLLDDYFKRNRFFSLIRETEDELRLMLGSGFWDNNVITQSKYSNHNYECRGNKLLIDGRIVGIGVALSTYGKVRMSNFPVGQKLTAASRVVLEAQIEEVESFAKKAPGGIQTVFYDEFEPICPTLPPTLRAAAYKHICSTVFRFRKGFKAMLCGNLPSNYSPLLEMFNFPNKSVDFGIFKSYTRTTHRPLAVWAHLAPTEGWQELNRDSYVGMLTEGTEDDMFTTGLPFRNVDFKKTPTSGYRRRHILYNLSGRGDELTFWKTHEGEFEITARTKNTSFPVYAFELRECHGRVRLLPERYATVLLNAFEGGRIAFDCSKSFEAFTRLIPNKKARSK